MAKFPERVFSGVQPTGNLHLGNYLGAIKRFVAMQATHPCIYCVVDLHAMTLPHEPAQLVRTTREVTAAFLAGGIDPKPTIIFNQSRVAEHAELAWIFDCVARLGWLNRMTQFKEKAGKDRENASVGLYNYPVLMAADILLISHPRAGRRRPEAAPGADARHRAEVQQRLRIDRRHGHGDAFFPLPEPLIQGPGDAGHEPARRHEEDVEVRPVGLARIIALTDDAGHDRAEDPQGQDRSRTAAERGRGPGGPAGGRQSRRHLRRPDRRDQGRGAEALRRQASSRRSRPRSPTWRSTSSRQFAPRSCASPAIRPMSIRSCARRRQGSRDRRTEYGRDQGHPWPDSDRRLAPGEIFLRRMSRRKRNPSADSCILLSDLNDLLDIA